MKFFLKHLFVVFLLSFSLAAQQFDYKKERFTIEKRATIKPRNIEEKWMMHVQNLESPTPGGTSGRSKLLTVKKALREKYPVKRNASKKTESILTEFTPSIGQMFSGNPQSGIPNDNDMAISNDGIVVSVINTTIYMYDTNTNELLFNSSLTDFDSELDITNFNYDPKVLYDPIADRFVMVFLSGFTNDNNFLVVSFSSTNNPLDEWHSYVLNGNPLDNETWSDYPSIAVSETDFYLAVNTFFDGSENNSGYFESTFWQIDLASGYEGKESLHTSYYHDIRDEGKAIFNLCPIKGGSRAYGASMYILGNKALVEESNVVYLMKIDNSNASGDANLSMKKLESEQNYYLPAEGHQPEEHTFDTGDSRILGGFYENNRIQFVQNCMDISNGLTGIYHGFIEYPDHSAKLTANIISDDVMDYGYPNIAYTGRAENDIESIISFNHSSPVDNAGCSAIYFGNDGLYSEQLILKEGKDYINSISGFYERWGDYTGIQRKFNEPGTTWSANSYGGSGKVSKTWISQLISGDSIRNPFGLSNYDGLSYPNPVANMMHVQFQIPETTVVSINIYNMKGDLVKKLVSDKIKAGVNTLDFSTDPLPSGQYILNISSNNWVFYKESFIKL